MKFIALFASICLLSISSAHPIKSGIYKLDRDKKLDGKYSEKQNAVHHQIQIKIAGTQITGHFVNLNNNSIFEGKIFSSKRNPNQYLIRLTQHDEDYVGVHTGVWADNVITGTWYSSTGMSGDFKISK